MADRTWMYSGWQRGKAPTNEWIENTKLLLDHAFSIAGVAEDNTIKCSCPCAKCRNYFSHERDEIEMHLCYNGFTENYETWIAHGETLGVMSEHASSSLAQEEFLTDRMDNMLIDLAGQQPPSIVEEPSDSAQAFYRMVASADEPVHESTTHSCISAIARLLAIKSQYNMCIANYDSLLELIHELLPGKSNMCKDFYRSKKLIEGLGMPYVKIDVCKNNCMLYYKVNEQKEKCDFCGTSRYVEGQNKVPHKLLRYLPLTERLQRLYAHEETAKQMRSHRRSSSNFMVHPCDGEAWQQFDKDYPLFASDPRNVRLVFSTDGFTPYGLGAAPYSCWPVFASLLNLPPGKLLKKEYIFLSLVIPGPQHPRKKLSVLMQPLIDELIELWEGRLTWDASLKQNFPMRAAFLWSVHDFPALGMVSGWSTHGKLACHICLTDSKAFQLTHGHKPCWFDCHRRFLPIDHEFRFQENAFRKDTVVLEGPPRRLTGEELLAHMHKNVVDTKNYNKLHNWSHISCFSQLEYFSKLKLPHNIDVMHNEKNVGEAIWNTCFDIRDKTKDNIKARQDLAEICDRPLLNLEPKDNGKWHKPRAPFCIGADDKIIILKWFRELMFPDGYAANISRGVNFFQRNFFGLKSHDYHIFIERLLPAAFRGFLPENVWLCLAELSYFYRQLCAKQLNKDVVRLMEENIVVLLCKLEKIFPPGFFNPMQHLIIHLPEEARLGGPVLSRWMYPFERCIGNLRPKVRNKARVEGSIVEAYLVEETTNFLSLYFNPKAHSIRNKAARYDDGASSFVPVCEFDIFQCPGRCISPRGYRTLTREEYKVALYYILTNIPEMDDIFKQFDKEQWKSRTKPTEKQLRELRLNGWKSGRGPDFFDWFKTHCMKSSNIHNALRQMSYEFRSKVRTYGIYDIKGYRFRSELYESEKSGLSTINTGVCVSSFDENDNVLEYYGVIKDIFKITWEGSMELELVLFDCHWFDPTPAGVRRTENLGLVEVKHTSRLSNFDPFVLASQVSPVYYLPYACKTRPDPSQWSIVYHVPPHGYLPPNSNTDESNTMNDVLIYQEDGLEGTFVIDLGDDLEVAAPLMSDDITDPKDLERLRKQQAGERVSDSDDDDEDDEDDAVADDDENQAPSYDPNDF